MYLGEVIRMIPATATWRAPEDACVAGLRVRQIGTVWIPPPGIQIQDRPVYRLHYLAFLMHGEAEFCYAGHTSRARAGDVLVMPAGDVYRYRSTDARGWRSCWFGFEAPGLPLSAGPRPMPSTAYPALIRAMRLARAREVAGPRLALALAEIVVELTVARKPRQQHEGPIERAIGQLRADPVRAWNLTALARSHGLSPLALRNGVRGRLGISPMQLLRDERMRLVADALDAGATVTEAARAGGFTDPFYCSRQFRRVFGCAPRQWRNAQQA
jgi:AraC-like DNA-binding protein